MLQSRKCGQGDRHTDGPDYYMKFKCMQYTSGPGHANLLWHTDEFKA